MAVTTADIRRVYPDTDSDDTVIQKFIANATSIVSGQLAGKGLTDSTLDLITTYVTAHLMVISQERGGLRRAKLGDVDESYVVPGDGSFAWTASRFGQTAIALDTSGTLAGQASNSGRKAEFRVV